MNRLLGFPLMAGLQLPLGAVSTSDLFDASATSLSLPTVVPTIYDPHAPNPQKKCPGYKVSNFESTHFGATANLDLAGEPCDVFGKDILNLTLSISYQTKERVGLKIEPRYLVPENASRHTLDDQFVKQPQHDGSSDVNSSDLMVEWSNEPSFQFSVSRRATGEEIFSTFGHVVVFEDQYLELVTNMNEDYNVYGLAETIRNFRFGTNFTATLFNVDSADAIDRNSYSSHPFYQETRYHKDKPSTAHGVYSRNAHGQEWLMREKTITYRTIGGGFDFYFLSGESSSEKQSTALEVIRQYQQCIGFPAMQMYWTLGFHQCHWGWHNIQDLQDVVDKYAEADIPLEAIWTDIDVYYKYRPLTNDPDRFPSKGMHDFVAGLRRNGQYYVPLVDSNVYYPAKNESFPPFDRGDKLGTFIRDHTGKDYFVGKAWPGDSVWADWHVASSQQWFTEELRLMDEATPFDGIWIDLNEPSNFNNVLASKLKARDSAEPVNEVTLSKNDSRSLDFPLYRINNARGTNQAIDGTIPFSALHNDNPPTREYDAHNLWSLGITRAAYNAISSTVHPGKRPFIITRSTFIGHGQYAGHWGGDNNSKWGAMFLSISQALTMSMAGIPMFGTDTCGFGGDAEEELCARWFQLNAFFPFYRNHYGVMEPPQEAYVWPRVADSTRLVIAVRYSLLTYMYTLLHYAHTRGDTLLRALAWEFPNDPSLRDCATQFLLGPSLLITPVLTQGATTVQGVFPGIGAGGERWYDTHLKKEVVDVKPGQNVTMDAPFERINVHVRGGSILPLQEPGNTTNTTRRNPYSLLVALDQYDEAVGSLYLDDGESIEPSEMKMAEFKYSGGVLSTTINGTYEARPPLAKITFLGVTGKLEHVNLSLDDGKSVQGLKHYTYEDGMLTIEGLEKHFRHGAWEREFGIFLS